MPIPRLREAKTRLWCQNFLASEKMCRGKGAEENRPIIFVSDDGRESGASLRDDQQKLAQRAVPSSQAPPYNKSKFPLSGMFSAGVKNFLYFFNITNFILI